MRFSFRPSPDRSNHPAVAVLDADSPPGLAFVRSLGRRGVPMHVYSPRKVPVSRLSRFTASFGACPDPEHADVFLPWLQAEVKKGHIAYVAPTSDLMAFYMAEFPECFPKDQPRAHAERGAILDMLFKHRFDDTCQRHGMRAPYTRFPLSKDEALSQAASYPYPVILKPKSHVGVGWARGVVVRNEADMRREFGPYPVRPEVKRLMDRFPELAWPMVQEYVPGALEHLYSVSGIMNERGEILAAAGSKKTQQWPPTLGVGIVFESWHDAGPMQQGLDFVRKALKSGIFELELIWDARTQTYVAIDLNPRAHGHIAFDIARHNDLPWLWYQLATGIDVPVQPPAKHDVRWLHAIPYHVGNLIGVAKGPERRAKWSNYVSNLRGHHVDIIHDDDDLLPSIGNAMYMLRHPGGLIRPFLRGH
jgi:predicted ATP-grasp superfamily ATP-dependent carboligase